MENLSAVLTSFIKKDSAVSDIYSDYPVKDPLTLAYENYGDRGLVYWADVTFTSTCTQCPSPNCCFASYSPGSILNGECITQEIEDLVKYH